MSVSSSNNVSLLILAYVNNSGFSLRKWYSSASFVIMSLSFCLNFLALRWLTIFSTHYYQQKVVHHTLGLILNLCWKYFRKKNRNKSLGRRENRISNLSKGVLQVMEWKNISDNMRHSANIASDIANDAWNINPIVYVYTHKMVGKHWVIVSPQHSVLGSECVFMFGTAFHLAVRYSSIFHIRPKNERR